MMHSTLPSDFRGILNDSTRGGTLDRYGEAVLVRKARFHAPSSLSLPMTRPVAAVVIFLVPSSLSLRMVVAVAIFLAQVG